MDKLKPCPFCGENGEEIQDRSYYLPHGIYIGIIYCSNCGGAMIDTNKNHCWYDRVELWNKRFCAEGEHKEQLLEYADKDTAYYANQEVLRPLT